MCQSFFEKTFICIVVVPWVMFSPVLKGYPGIYYGFYFLYGQYCGDTCVSGEVFNTLGQLTFDPMLLAVLKDGRWICLGEWFD